MLLDAPCSATGTIRRHPDVPRLRRPRDVAELAAGQDRMLDAAARMLRPGGRLIYAVCSLQPEEGAQRVADPARFGLRPDPFTPDELAAIPEARTAGRAPAHPSRPLAASAAASTASSPPGWSQDLTACIARRRPLEPVPMSAVARRSRRPSLAAAGVLVAPSLLAADFARLGEEAGAVEAAGADWLHLDIMDGHFVPEHLVRPAGAEGAARRTRRLPFDVHLMISPADPYIPAFAEAGADHIIVHAEAGPHLHRSLQLIRSLGKRAGVALNPGTPAEAVEPVLDSVDLILVDDRQPRLRRPGVPASHAAEDRPAARA